MSRKTSKTKAIASTTKQQGTTKATPAKWRARSTTKAKRAASTASTRREGTKPAKLIAMLQGANGASVAEIAKALAWQEHTVRGSLAP